LVFSGRAIDSAAPIAKSTPAGFEKCWSLRIKAPENACRESFRRLKRESTRISTAGRRRKVESILVNDFKTNSRKDVPVNRMKNETMPAEDERRELIPVIIAGVVAVVGLFCLWSDLRDDSLGRGDGMITSAVATRAGVIVTPSEPPTRLGMPQTAPAFEPATVGRVTH
jgi:hypothetical protein